MDLVDLKKKYNQLLGRVYKADEFFKNPAISHGEKVKHEPLLCSLMVELGETGKLIEKITGVKMPSEQVLNGFDEVRGGKS